MTTTINAMMIRNGNDAISYFRSYSKIAVSTRVKKRLVCPMGRTAWISMIMPARKVSTKRNDSFQIAVAQIRSRSVKGNVVITLSRNRKIKKTVKNIAFFISKKNKNKSKFFNSDPRLYIC